MADTVRTRTGMLARFPDNTARMITPQDLRDFVVSNMPSGRQWEYVLATSDATPEQKAWADDVMTGSDDQLKLASALAALPGGKGTVAVIGRTASCLVDSDADQVQLANGQSVCLSAGVTVNVTVSGTDRWLFMVDGTSTEKKEVSFIGAGTVIVSGGQDNQGWLRVKGQFSEIFVAPTLKFKAADPSTAQGPGLYVSGNSGFGGRHCYFGGQYEEWGFTSGDDEDGPVMVDEHVHSTVFDLNVRRCSYGLSLYFRDYLCSLVTTWNGASFNDITQASDGDITNGGSTNLNRSAVDANAPIGDWLATRWTRPPDGVVFFTGASVNAVPCYLVVETLGPVITGTHTSPDTSGDNDFLVDTSKNFKALGVRAGSVVRNVTDGSQMVVSSISGTNELRGKLWGGTDNNWQTGDSYRVTWRRQRVLVNETVGANGPWQKPGEIVWGRPREDEWDALGDAGLSIGQAAKGAGYWVRFRFEEADGSAANPDAVTVAEVLGYRLPQDCLVQGRATQLTRTGVQVRSGHRIHTSCVLSDMDNHGINWNSHDVASITTGAVDRYVKTRWCQDYSNIDNSRDTMLLTRAAHGCWWHGTYTNGATACWEQDASSDWQKVVACGFDGFADGFGRELARVTGDYCYVGGKTGAVAQDHTVADDEFRSVVNFRRPAGVSQPTGNVLDFDYVDPARAIGSARYAIHVNQALGGGITAPQLVKGGRFDGHSVGPVLDTNGVLTYKGNTEGLVVENGGTATIVSGQTSVVVSHGLPRAPAPADLWVTPSNSMGSASKFWVSSPTSTQFTINVNADPGATTAQFAWRARLVK